MSATSLLLDGQDLDDLYARAGELEGWVVRVERVRRGGVVGLLGGRRYELTLDVEGTGERPEDLVADGPPPWVAPHPEAPPARARRSGGVEGVDEPRDGALGASPRGAAPGTPATGVVTPGPGTPTVGLPASPPVPGRAPEPGGRARGSGGLDGADEPRTVPPAEARSGLASLLAAADDGDERAGALAPPLGSPAVTTPDRPTSTPVPPPPRLERPARQARSVRPATFPSLGSVLLGSATPALGSATPALGSATPAPASPASPARAVPSASAPVAVPERLRALGVPSQLVPPDPASTSALLSLATRLPEPPALAAAPGAVVAVVGASDVVLETCAQMLAAVTAPAVRLVIVGEVDGAPGLRLVDPAVAARVRRDSTDVLVVVAVAATTDVDHLARASAVLDALRPDQSWAALDADRPRGGLAADLAAAAETVGGLDALAIQRASRSPRPGVLLGLGLPVGWLDGRPATPVTWAALLEDALRRAGEDGRVGVRTG